MTPGECMYCGLNPAEGYACVEQGGVTKWYCHGDDEGASCYERQGIERYVNVRKDGSVYEIETMLLPENLRGDFK